MYTDADGNEVACGDPQAGLYVKNRLGKQSKLFIIVRKINKKK